MAGCLSVSNYMPYSSLDFGWRSGLGIPDGACLLSLGRVAPVLFTAQPTPLFLYRVTIQRRYYSERYMIYYQGGGSVLYEPAHSLGHLNRMMVDLQSRLRCTELLHIRNKSKSIAVPQVPGNPPQDFVSKPLGGIRPSRAALSKDGR